MTSESLDEFVRHLQEKINKEEEATYSKEVLQEYRNPTHFGTLQKLDRWGEITGSCGDTMRISLRLKAGIIDKARFWTDGCGPTVACGNKLMKLIERNNLGYVERLSEQDLLIALGGLPSEHRHCATLAITTLQTALKNKSPSQEKSV